MADVFPAVRLNQVLSDKLTNAGLTPVVTDLRRSDAFVRLFTQVLDALGVVSLDIVASPAAIANLAVETAFGAPAQLVFPAGVLSLAGTRVDFKAGGQLATTGTPTTTFGARLGGIAGTIVGNGAALTCANNSTAAGWAMQGGFVVRTAGAAGVIVRDAMRSSIGNAANGGAAALDALGDSLVVAAVDLTAALTLVATQTWSAADPANAATMNYFNVTVKRADA